MGRPVALITGGSRGIGAGIALEMSKAGYDIAITYNSSKDHAMDVIARVEANGVNATVIRADISKLEDIERLFDELFKVFDHVNVLVNNAGVTRFAPFLNTTPEMFEELTNTDWRGSFFCAQKAAQNMIDNQVKGTIINITSNHQYACWPQASVYGPTKSALNKFTYNAALELAPYGIRVVSIAPGYTIVREPDPARENMIKTIENRIPLGRFCEPWEVGRACVFLAGDGSGYITGTCLDMDGGALLPVVPENKYINR